MKKIVIKVGSSVLMNKEHELDEVHIAHIAGQVAELKQKGFGVVLVVSGAVSCGAHITGSEPVNLQDRQAAAGIGQPYLISVLADIFSKEKLVVAQILLTEDIFRSDIRKKNLLELLNVYIGRGVISIINENDAVELNSFAGNDFLCAHVAKLVGADKVLMLSTMAGSKHGVGGGKSKYEAVASLKDDGFHAVILDGKAHNIILDNIA